MTKDQKATKNYQPITSPICIKCGDEINPDSHTCLTCGHEHESEENDMFLNVSASNLKTCSSCENLFPGTLLECPKCGHSEPINV